MQANQSLKFFWTNLLQTILNWSWEQWCAAAIFCLTVLYSSLILLGSMQAPLGQSLPIKTAVADSSNLTYQFAKNRLNEVGQTSTQLQNGLKTQWYWLSLDLPSTDLGGAKLLFDKDNLMSANCQGLNLRYNQLYWYANLTDVQAGQSVICKVWMVGAGSVEVHTVNNDLFQALNLKKAEKNLFLQGVLFALVTLTILSAMATKKRVFLAYGVWLLVSLRVVLITTGQDTSFWGWTIPLEWLPTLRAAAFSLYVITSLWLIIELLESALLTIRSEIKTIIWSGFLLLMGLALLTPYSVFLFVITGLTALISVVSLVLSIESVFRRYPAIVSLCLLGLGLILFVLLAELLSVWLPGQMAAVGFSSQSAPILSSWLFVITVLQGDRMASQTRQRALQVIRTTQARMSKVFEMSPAPMFTVRPNGQISTFNTSFKQLLLKLGKADFLQPDFLMVMWRRLQSVKQPWSFQYRHIDESNKIHWYELTLVDHDDELIGSVRDITSEKDRETELRYQINHDELTGALNRRGLDDCLVDYQIGGLNNVVLAFIDIKRFRNVVKAHGLALADQLLVRFYLLILQTIGHCGDIVRFGHDQFMVVQSDQRLYDRYLEGLQTLVKTLRHQPLVVEGVHTTIQVQVGVMHLHLDSDHHGLLSLVEDLAHEMKFRFRQSGQSYLLFTQEESLKLIQAARLSEQILNKGLPDNLFLCWQPILNISGNKYTLSAEALLRQTDGDGKYYSAGSVIETCCNRGRTALLDTWVLGQTLDFLDTNIDKLDHLMGVGVNVSPYSLNDDSFLSAAVDLFKRAARVCHKVYIEVTEVGTILNPEAVNRFVAVIRTMGVRVSLDDFGAGFSNFQYVIDLKADVIKIDGSIASQVQNNIQSRSVVKAIVNLAQDLSCTTVAEGVTDLATYQELKALGVDYLQGFLVSRAVPPEQFLDKINCQSFYDKLWANGHRGQVSMA